MTAQGSEIERVMASVITVVMAFTAALLLLYAGFEVPGSDRAADEKQRERRRSLRRIGLGAAIVALIAAYFAVLSP
jgi:ABC-type Fe3+ transport system permease subunit